MKVLREIDMEPSLRQRSVVFGICAAFLLLSALVGDLTSSGEAQVPTKAGSRPARFGPAAATGAFGLDLIDALPPGNAVVSPDSVATALSMAGTGATRTTAAEIARVLRLTGPETFTAVGDLQRAIAARQASAGEGDPSAPTLGLANGLFVQRGFQLKPGFLGGLQEHFEAAPDVVDFAGDPQGSVDAINSWVSEHTGGIIPQLLNSVAAETRLMLTNAVYLKAKWRHQFDPMDTDPAPFFRRSGKTRIEFMNQLEQLRYGAGRAWRAVELPYRASSLSLLVVLPVGKSLTALQRRLSVRGLAPVVRGLKPETVELSLPRFHLTAHLELNAILKSLGMKAAFSAAADFSRMTASEALQIDMVEHAADLSVDEEGTVAAAATAVGIRAVSAPAIPSGTIPFNANRPFLFFVRDRETGAVLFAGRLVNPS